MPLAAALVLIFLVAMLIVFGVLIKYFKCYGLISGYNTMSAEKKRNVDTEGLGRFMGNFCFVIAGIILAAGILGYLGYQEAFAITILSLFIVIPIMVIKAQKFDGNARNPDGTMKRGTKVFLALLILGFLLILGIVAGSMIDSSREMVVNVTADYIDIHGAYGVKLKTCDIEGIELVDSIPKVIRKTNGFDFGSLMRGNFKLEGLGAGKLYVDLNKKPFIHISTMDSFIIINLKTSEDTKKLYDEIRTVMKLK